MENSEGEKLSRREREWQRHRSEILDAALELFSRSGYHNVTMAEIAEHAEFSVGTLYKFFKNKEALYKALLLDRSSRVFSVFRSILTGQEEDAIETIKKFVQAKAAEFKKESALIQLYYAETQGAHFIKSGFDHDLKAMTEEIHVLLAKVVQRGIEQGGLSKGDPVAMALALEGMSNAFFFECIEKPNQYSYGECTQTILDIFFEGVKAT